MVNWNKIATSLVHRATGQRLVSEAALQTFMGLAPIIAEMKESMAEMEAKMSDMAALASNAERRLSSQIQANTDDIAEDRPKLSSLEAGSNELLRVHRLQTLGRLLRPRSVHGYEKMRLGAEKDGGYVFLNDLDEIAGVISLGIGDDVSWDVEIADRGLIVDQFDHSVSEPPVAHRNFRFHRKMISTFVDDNNETISNILRLRGYNKAASVILKMDIEGSEWSVLKSVPDDALDLTAQIICEFHHFGNVTELQQFELMYDVLTRLRDKFEVVHVHGNNSHPTVMHGFPNILEVTFANRNKYSFEMNTELFPTALDAPNLIDLPDHRLGDFLF